MDRGKALLVSLILLCAYWVVSPVIFDYSLDFTDPVLIILFSLAASSTVIIGGSLALLTIHVLTRGKE